MLLTYHLDSVLAMLYEISTRMPLGGRARCNLIKDRI